MRLPIHVAVGFVTLVTIGAAWTALFATTRIAPVPVAVIALYFGLTSRGHLASAVAAAICTGYFADVLLGAPTGLFALTCALTAIVGHVVQGRFVLRGQLLGAGVSAAAGGLFLLVSASISEALGPATVGHLSIVTIVASAGLTALVGPLQLGLHRRVDSRLVRTQRERDARLEGVSAA